MNKYENFVESLYIPGFVFTGIFVVVSACGSVGYFIVKAAQALGCGQ